jgi:3-oxoacyl-[acyl-carrier-protein] synthase-3
MVTQTPDYFQPSTAAYLHGVLHLTENCAAFDVNLGCSGYVYGLWLAFMMVEAGSCENVLLLAGDTMSKCVNAKDKSVVALFGDAGSATLIERYEAGSAFFSLHTDGKGFRHIMVPAGAFRLPKDTTTSISAVDDNGNSRSLENLSMNSAEVFNFAIKVEPAAINEILEFANKTEKDVDYIIFQQSNKYLINNIARRLKFPLEKAPCGTVAKYGNQSCASIPAAICDSMNIQVSNDVKTVILSGFGVGLSWASCLVRLDNIYVRLTGFTK